MGEGYNVLTDTNTHIALAVETLAAFDADISITCSVSPTSPADSSGNTLATGKYARGFMVSVDGTIEILPPGSAAAVTLTVKAGVVYPIACKQIGNGGTINNTANIFVMR